MFIYIYISYLFSGLVIYVYIYIYIYILSLRVSLWEAVRVPRCRQPRERTEPNDNDNNPVCEPGSLCWILRGDRGATNYLLLLFKSKTLDPKTRTLKP